MLKHFFSWLDAHPTSYWAAAVPASFLLITATLAAIRRPPGDSARPLRQEWRYLLAALVFLVAWRWPFLLESKELNADESQLIAGAHTLTHDPVFWRSVDGTTSGPLNFYALIPLRALGLPFDYFSARIAGLALVALALLAVYRLLRSHGGPAAARLGILPALVFFATTTDADFLHYSSEHASLPLLAWASYGLLARGPSARGQWLGALAAGLLPWAKLQTAPLAAILVLGGLARVWFDQERDKRDRLRAVASLCAAAVLPSIVALTVIALTGQFAAFLQGYVFQNALYVDGGNTLRATVRELVRKLEYTAYLPFAAAVAAAALGLAVLSGLQRRRPGPFVLMTGLMVVTAVACALAPRRSFVHYFLLTPIPLTLWIGATIADAWPSVRHRRSFTLVLLLVLGLGPLGARLAYPAPDIFGRFADCWRHPYSASGTVIRAYAPAGDSLAVWGWQTDLYVDSGLPQATRDPHTVWSIVATPSRDYYRARYLADLQRNRPTFFVDAVGPEAVYFWDRKNEGHETFPALAEYIEREYRLLADFGSTRVYVRADSRSLPGGKIPASKLQRLIGLSRPTLGARSRTSLETANQGGWDIDGRGVQMFLPPARASWALNGTEREFVVEYGFHPRAYTEGKTNGADFIVELESAASPTRLLWRQRLDPIQRPADRGPLSTRFMLPPYSAGSRIVVRSEPGDYGDTAWDWVYLAAVKFRSSPIYLVEQFPNFGVVPNEAHTERAMLVGPENARVLALRGPSRFTYVLAGDERHLALALHEYSPGGPPPAAPFPIELSVLVQPAGAPERLLLKRAIDAGVPARAHLDLDLPPLQAGDTLTVHVEPSDAAAARAFAISALRFQ